MKNKSLIFTIIAVIVIGALIFVLNNYTKSVQPAPSQVAENNSPSNNEDQNTSSNVNSNTTEQSEPKIGNQVGDIAPDFTLKDLDGNTVTLSSLRGKKVILNFWATTCPYCIIEMPALNQFIKSHKDDTVLLAIDLGESPSKVKQYLEGKGYEFTVLLDTDLSTIYDYQVQFIPMSYFIDKNGIIRAISNGAMTYDEIEEYYKSISR
ncbi:MAG: Alkyl hydroperoxide reductase/ Thiol specific antioxidant/ Mal allergen [Caldanaerobacter subterraneus]|uniref:Alkyl hydroperoxide reductase/ Thiol specific antioxidant/ Mal allergen n=2 Tax=Thermoanaerobacter TaxID=1754 RepID=B0K936_THEP3|nr:MULTISPECIES: TlpA disulfide reductase family protein [Thermoanaerobacter]KUK34860.1 MAG: Alkyl hydroperoxide reductase/ Thiol specific antioxidant/ Mal allergen [Caldanaerobacter subterraneus]ABY92724.1 alkyl hydroperoxide reductase/ Thiol specific antioxidant/ Mal allergen [Thermoanaerobacter sp. X514]ABY94649.1 alkyl hydroperoxide reductase/ Thiol specific antioxidant/ Mal allergen [Thermoanaerobacter pseudethanolicus ATCC 33223]ADV79597.1 alkyl hydroperoxide reductase/ Thiol specific ant